MGYYYSKFNFRGSIRSNVQIDRNGVIPNQTIQVIWTTSEVIH